MSLPAAAGVIAGVLGFFDAYPYIRHTLKGTTRPHRGSWLIWGVLGIIVFSSQLADGATWSLIMVGSQTVLIIAIFLLSLRFGEGELTRTNTALLLLAGLGCAGWALASAPVIATYCVVFADAIGVVMMLPKTWRDPSSETFATYALASGSGVLSALAVGRLDAHLLVYPIYFAASCGLLAGVIAYRHRVLREVPSLAPGDTRHV